MNNKLLAPLVAGFGAGVLSVVPILKSFACCLIVPAAAYFSIVLYRRSTNSDEMMKTATALTLGVVTGVFAALFATTFEIFITLFTKHNDLIESFGAMQNMLNNFPIDDALRQQVIDLIGNVVRDIQETGFSFIYTITLLFNNLLINSIFGLVGGVIGLQVINSKFKRR